MKRKSEAHANGKSKKRAISDDEAHDNFRKGLFDTAALKDYTDSYAASQPYVHVPAYPTAFLVPFLTPSPDTSTP
jgi:hypothetical protein